MKSFLIATVLFLGLAAQAGNKIVESVDNPPATPAPIGTKTQLSTLCIYTTDYSGIAAYDYCQEDMNTIALLSTNKVQIKTRCVLPSADNFCSARNGYHLISTMTTY